MPRHTIEQEDDYGDTGHELKEDEMTCHGCTRPIKQDDAIKCNACRGKFCTTCLDQNWLETEEVICWTCNEQTEQWVKNLIEKLVRQMNLKDARIEELKNIPY